MTKLFTTALLLLLSASLTGCLASDPAVQQPERIPQETLSPSDSGHLQAVSSPSDEEQPQEVPPPSGKEGEEAVRALVEEFGRRLQAVSLQAPADVVGQSMEEQYGGLVAPEVLLSWKSNLPDAPGRLTSSPWPDRIEILQVTRMDDGSYQVDGEVIEVTSVDLAGSVAAKRPIRLVVAWRGERWLIGSARLGLYSDAKMVDYTNTEFGFRITLPGSWQGYEVLPERWNGPSTAPGSERTVESGPMLVIRHPAWTEEIPRQDIPIMVFTISQWEALQRGTFHIGAGPVGPSELGRNARYVFGLPARYNYAFRAGYREVEEILRSNPLEALDTVDLGE